METIAIFKNKLTQLLVLVFTVSMNMVIFAQGDSGVVETTKSVNSTTTTKTTEWYADPTYLAIGAIVIILIVLLLARGGKRNKD